MKPIDTSKCPKCGNTHLYPVKFCSNCKTQMPRIFSSMAEKRRFEMQTNDRNKG